MSSPLYLSLHLPTHHLAVYEQIKTACDQLGQEVKLLPNTNDIWVRDFMPIPLPDGTLLEYRYDPDYLQVASRDGRGSKSYPDLICDAMKWPTQKTAMIIDGGNLIRQGNMLIMADKVVWENRHHYTKNELVKALKTEFQVEQLVLLPWDKKYDPYGHADSMLRFIDDNTVLVNYYYAGYKELITPLEKAGLQVKCLQFSNINYKEDHLWPYLNFVQTDKLMLYTAIDEHHDKEAKEQFERYFPKFKCCMRGIHMPEIIKDGGALHCMSWVF